jgi:hypothetical protein
LRLSPWILQTQTGNMRESRNHAHLRRPAIPPAATSSRHQEEEEAVVKATRRNSPPRNAVEPAALVPTPPPDRPPTDRGRSPHRRWEAGVRRIHA